MLACGPRRVRLSALNSRPSSVSYPHVRPLHSSLGCPRNARCCCTSPVSNLGYLGLVPCAYRPHKNFFGVTYPDLAAEVKPTIDSGSLPIRGEGSRSVVVEWSFRGPNPLADLSANPSRAGQEGGTALYYLQVKPSPFVLSRFLAADSPVASTLVFAFKTFPTHKKKPRKKQWCAGD